MNQIKKHIKQLLKKKTRLDGRKNDEYRDISIEFGVSKTAEGSALIKIGDTQVMAGVKMGIEKPYPDTPDRGSLMVNVEFSPIASPDFERGPPSIDAIELARVVDRGIRESKAIDFKKLCVEVGEAVWMIMIDIIPLNDAGNLFDASGLAAVAAIMNARMPEYKDGVVNYKKKTDQKVPMDDVPIPVTIIKINDNLLVDPVKEEYESLDSRLTVASLDKDTLCAMQKGGDEALTIDEIDEITKLACEKGEFIRNKLLEALK